MFNKKDSVQDNQQDNLSLSPETMVFLALMKQPFSSIILSEDGIYKNTVLDQLLETSLHHLQFSDLVLIIEGQLGSGKTTLFRHLIQHEIPNLKLLPVLAEATDTLVQLQQKMSIHLQDQGNANYLDDNLKRLSVFDQTPVLLIDDAHVLSDTTLQELIRYIETLKTGKETQLKLLLFANKGMAGTLEQISNLQHNQLFVQQMPEFNTKQAADFLQHKLAQADYQGEMLFDEKDIEFILKKFGALPEQILKGGCHHLKKVSKRKRKSSASSLSATIRPVILFPILTLILAVAIGVYFYQQIDAYKTNDPALQTDISETPVPPAPAANQHALSIDSTALDEPTTETVETLNPENTTELTPEIADSDTIDTAAVTEMAATPGDDLTTPSTLSSESTTEPAEQAVAPVTGMTKPAQTIENDAELTPVAPPVPEAPPIAPPVKNPATSKTDVALITPRLTVPEAHADINPALEQLATIGIHDGNWLLKQDKTHWTLQILGARDPQTLLKFARANNLGDDTAWYKTQLTNKPWYILVHRIYTDQNIARQSIARLPANLQKSRPWVKSLDAVHKAIQP